MIASRSSFVAALDLYTLQCVEQLGREGDATFNSIGHALEGYDPDPVTRVTALIAKGWLAICGGHLAITDAGDFIIKMRIKA